MSKKFSSWGLAAIRWSYPNHSPGGGILNKLSTAVDTQLNKREIPETLVLNAWVGPEDWSKLFEQYQPRKPSPGREPEGRGDGNNGRPSAAPMRTFPSGPVGR